MKIFLLNLNHRNVDFLTLITCVRVFCNNKHCNWSQRESLQFRANSSYRPIVFFYSIFAAVRETDRFTGIYRRIRYLPITRCRPLFRHEHVTGCGRILSRFAGVLRSVLGCPIDFLPLCNYLHDVEPGSKVRDESESAARRGIRLNYGPGGSFVYSGIHYPGATGQLSSAICNPTPAV